ncbi:hypothetical protein ACFX59_04670 [Sphingomonas sp. NCPPB 2930]|uniref:hypothetical protein n=1 Tax=Sphingomonas sp. NCPPB 2930 TaxID=3162788 RepID=UPI0036D84523
MTFDDCRWPDRGTIDEFIAFPASPSLREYGGCLDRHLPNVAASPDRWHRLLFLHRLTCHRRLLAVIES